MENGKKIQLPRLGGAISIDSLPFINYSIQVNAVKCLRHFILYNNSDTDWQQVLIRIEGEHIEESTAYIAVLPAGGEVSLPELSIRAKGDTLANLSEGLHTHYTIEYSVGGEILERSQHELLLMTFDQWTGSDFHPELLTAFITPNHPMVSSILVQVAQILEERTGSSSILGYQADSHSAVFLQVEALYEVLRKMGLVYATAPASFEIVGQRIRPIDQIVSEKIGNCMDLSLLFASCLEAMGLNPILVLQKGHIFPGVYLHDTYYENTVCDDLTHLQKGLENGVHDLIVFEGTAITNPDITKFDEALNLGEAMVRKEAERFEFAIDIHACRLNGVRPMPRRLVEEGKVRLVNDGLSYRHERSRQRQFDLLRMEDSQQEDKHKNPKQLLWERKLLDLSLNNRLLNIRLGGSSALQLMTESLQSLYESFSGGERFALEGSVQVIQSEQVEWQNSAKDKPYDTSQLCKSSDLARIVQDELISSLKRKRLHSYAESSEHYAILKQLHRGAKVAMEENGANSLYLALGFVRWTEIEGGKVHSAPLLLLPVELKRKNLQSYTLELQDAEPSFNITLIEYFYQQTNYRMTGLHPLPLNEEGNIDVELVLARMRAYVRQMKGWEVVEEVVLGNFSFSKFVMWHDIHSHSEVLEAHPITSALMGQVQPNVDDSLVPCQFTAQDLERAEEEELLLPLEADSSQIEAVLEAVRGKSFVLHGPPGTGKSQTITNIIANMLGQGKRVLFVAEKMAALEVVQKRMERVGLGDFCLELHGNKVTKKHFLAQMERAINVQREDKKSGRHFADKRKHTESERNKILAYTEALHRQRPEGYSLYDLIVRYEAISQPALELSHSPQLHYDEAMEQLGRELRQLESILRISGSPEHHPLKNFILRNAEAPHNTEELRQLLSRSEALISEGEQWASSLAQLIGLSPTEQLQSHELIAEIVSRLAQMPRFSEEYLQLAERVGGIDEGQRACRLMSEYLKVRSEMQSRYHCLPDIKCRDLAQRYRQAEDKWFLPRYFARKALLKELHSLGLSIDYTAIPQLITALGEYETAEGAISANDKDLLRRLVAYEGYGTEELWQELSQYLVHTEVLMQSLIKLATVHQVPYSQIRADFSQQTNQAWHIKLASEGGQLKSYIDFAQRLSTGLAELRQLIDLADGLSLTNLKSQLKQWQEHLPDLRNWTQWLLRRQALMNLGAKDVVRHIEQGTDIATLPERTERALYKQIAQDIIGQEAALSMFQGLIFEEAIKLYRELSTELHSLARNELYRRVAERVPDGINNSSTELTQELALLKRFIASGGRARSIRSMLDAIPNLLPSLAPCMLMSPLSVAQYIAMDAPKFDLVIFDEASQMPTSDAVGTIARGKALVVVGDPKQMPPTSFFLSQQTSEDEADIDDMESILDDCIALSIPSRYLAWHYRSRHESLIAFSNNCFYEGRLYTFPSVDNQTSKLRFIRVEGTYARSGSRNNVVEAEAVVDELLRRVQDPELRSKSIGIVAFSQSQQELIEDKLYARTHKHSELDKLLAELPEPLFIKNLENVQGDERDVILFSVGYGPDSEGKVSMNFGPLNNKGGERRLNVAASRARYEMLIFSSITADQIDLRRTESEGVASLKLLLECASLGTNRLSSRAEQLRLPSSIIHEVAEALRAQGYRVDLMVGTSNFRVDIAVHHPKQEGAYLAGIICDGEGYYRTRTVRDRECVQQSVLRGLGWQILRLWTLDWHTERERTLNNLLMSLDALK